MPYRRRTVVTVARVALLGAAVALFSSGPRRAPETAMGPPPAAVPPAPVAAPLPDLGGDAGPAPTCAASEPSLLGALPPAIAPSEPEAAIEGDVWLDGTVVLVADTGEARRSESGSLTLRVFPKGGERRDLVLPVTAGRFSASVPRASELEAWRIELGSVLARPVESRDFFPPPDDGMLEVRVRALPTLVLHVLDSSTREPLHDVTVVRRFGWTAGDLVVAGAHSPVRVTTDDRFAGRSNAFGVHAPGYAWARFDAAGAANEATVLLERGGDLLVVLENYRPILPGARDEATRRFWIATGEIPYGQAAIRIVRVSESSDAAPADPVRVVPDPDAPTRVLGLAPGEYRVQVSLPAASREPVVLGEADVTVVAGAEAEIAIRLLDAPAASEPAPLSGTLHIPAGWGEEPMRVVFRPLDVPGRSNSDAVYLRPDEMIAEPGLAGLWRWDAGLVWPGAYAAEIGEFAVDEPVRVGETGLVGLALALPEPARVTLRIVSEETGGPLEVRNLAWYASEAEDDSEPARRSRGGVIGPTQLGVCRFVCPAGEIGIGGGRGVRLEPDRVTVVSGENDVTLRATLSCGILIYVPSRENRAIHALLAFTFSLRRADGSGFLFAGESEQGFATIPCPEPGDYEVTIDPIEGFEPVEPLRVTVAAGEWKDLALRIRPLGTGDGE